MKHRDTDSFIRTNEEYVKRRGSKQGAKAPREQPERQMPGEQGHHKPDYRRWTTEELCSHAARLGIENAECESRERLIQLLEERD